MSDNSQRPDSHEQDNTLDKKPKPVLPPIKITEAAAEGKQGDEKAEDGFGPSTWLDHAANAMIRRFLW